MKAKLRVKELARERGMTLWSIARRLKIARSNMSGIVSGIRGVSFKVLRQISSILDCSIDELIVSAEHEAVFNDTGAQAKLKVIENKNYDGIDKTWVNRVMSAQRRHYGSIGKGAR